MNKVFKNSMYKKVKINLSKTIIMMPRLRIKFIKKTSGCLNLNFFDDKPNIFKKS